MPITISYSHVFKCLILSDQLPKTQIILNSLQFKTKKEENSHILEGGTIKRLPFWLQKRL